MNLNSILGGLKQGLSAVQALEPLAALGGPGAAGLANIVAGLAEMGEDALTSIQSGVVAASAEDKAELESFIEQIQAKNDATAAAIRKS